MNNHDENTCDCGQSTCPVCNDQFREYMESPQFQEYMKPILSGYDDDDDTDPLGIFEIGPFGKIDHHMDRGELVDTWMDNEGSLQSRILKVPKSSEFTVFSGGILIYHWTPEAGGQWYGSEKRRRYSEHNEQLRGE